MAWTQVADHCVNFIIIITKSYIKSEIFKHPTKLVASSKLSIKVTQERSAIAEGERQPEQRVWEQKIQRLWNTIPVKTVFKYLLNGIPSHVLTVIRMLTFFLAGISKNKHNYRLPRFCVFLYQVQIPGNCLQQRHNK